MSQRCQHGADPSSVPATGSSFTVSLSRAPASRDSLFCQRIRAYLDMHCAWLRTLAALHHPWHAVATRAPKSPALPSSIWIVNAPVEALSEEAERVRDAQHHHLPVLESDETVIEVGSRDRDILAKADRVVMIDPRIVARLGAGGFEALQTGARIFVVSKAFRAVIAGRVRPIQRILAFAAVETDQTPV